MNCTKSTTNIEIQICVFKYLLWSFYDDLNHLQTFLETLKNFIQSQISLTFCEQCMHTGLRCIKRTRVFPGSNNQNCLSRVPITYRLTLRTPTFDQRCP